MKDRRPKRDDLAHSLFLDAGRDAEKADRFEEAIPIVQEAARARPGDALAWYDLGDALLGAARDREALEPLERALGLRPAFLLARYSHGLALMRLGRREEAAAEFRVVLAPDPKVRRAQSSLGASALTNLALCLADQGDVKAGLETMALALPGAASILFNMGCLHRRRGEHGRAFAYLSAAVIAVPDDAEMLGMAASSALEVGILAPAEDWLRNAVRLDSGKSRVWYDLGLCLARQKKPGAMAAFQRAAKLEPGFPWAHYDIACLHALAGRTEAAFRELGRAVECGLDAVEHVRKDRELAALHGDPRWREIVEGVRANAVLSVSSGNEA